jgi:Tol biopolymer transport system component
MAIYIANVQTGEVRRLAAGINPTWSPDGSRVAYLSNQSGLPAIWTIKNDGFGLQQLTADGQLIWQMYWWRPVGLMHP